MPPENPYLFSSSLPLSPDPLPDEAHLPDRVCFTACPWVSLAERGSPARMQYGNSYGRTKSVTKNKSL